MKSMDGLGLGLGLGITILALLVATVIMLGVMLGMQNSRTGTTTLIPSSSGSGKIRRFLWGGATSAFQIEGNLTAGGRAPSIWDTFVKNPQVVGYADLACNSYYQFKDDISVLKRMGATSYRLSVAWPRVIKFTGAGSAPGPHAAVNLAGVAYYRAVLKECLAAGLTPVVTLYHWDLPQALQQLYNGWLCAASYGPDGSLVPVDVSSPTDTELAIVSDFVAYAQVCFEAFGDLVDYWATINEPQTIAVDCYEFDWYAPGAGTPDGNCPSGIDYRAGHNLLLAHAAACAAFRRKFGGAVGTQKHIGLACNMDWGEPLDKDSAQDVAAAQRGNVFWGGWFWDPLFYGQYPAEMRTAVGRRLPAFTAAQSLALRGSFTILYWNTYSTSYVTPATAATKAMVGWTYDQDTSMTPIGKDGKVIGTAGQSTWLHMVPWGAAKCLLWIQNRYSRPHGPSAPGAGAVGTGLTLFQTPGSEPTPVPLVVTENGIDIANETIDTALHTAVQDCVRTTYFAGYVKALTEAAALCGVDFAGYMPWSLLDNYEWSHGFTARFGMTYLDFTDGKGKLLQSGGPDVVLPRTIKQSALALKGILKDAGLVA
jgi:beta-glucosidase